MRLAAGLRWGSFIEISCSVACRLIDWTVADDVSRIRLVTASGPQVNCRSANQHHVLPHEGPYIYTLNILLSSIFPFPALLSSPVCFHFAYVCFFSIQPSLLYFSHPFLFPFIFTARCYACAVPAMGLCLFDCLSVCLSQVGVRAQYDILLNCAL